MHEAILILVIISFAVISWRTMMKGNAEEREILRRQRRQFHLMHKQGLNQHLTPPFESEPDHSFRKQRYEKDE